ncbi:MAG: hypothetical protein HOO67_01095 [Candidatus Peribacteraceae bacterium]|nr:hypothetical protein [Candidatus Peribacteraceae bacterium]
MHRFLFLFQALLATVLLAVPAIVFAVEQYPPIMCDGLFGCGAPPSNVILESGLPVAATLLMQLAAGGAVIAIVIAGTQMAVSYGDEAKTTSARKAILYALGGLGLALASMSIVSFVTTEDFGIAPGGTVITVMASIVRIILNLFNVGFAIVIILAGLRMITAQGVADEFKKGGQMIKWAIIGGVVVNLAKVGIQAFLELNL